MSREKIRFGRCTLFKQDRSPFYNLRVMVRGKRRQFSTGESTKAQALDKAKAIVADLKSRGLIETIALHSRRVDEIPADPTFEEFSALYEKVMLASEYPPAFQTRSRYVKSLKFMGRALRINRVRTLTPDKIKRFITEYQEDGANEQREPGSVKTSLNSILRNSAALFSRTALAGYKDHGLALANPFTGLKLRRVEIKGYSPLKADILQNVWKNAVLLRDGDPTHVPTAACTDAKWKQPDWSKPNIPAYLLLLLELGLGLRRHESEKAEKDWFLEDAQGRLFLEVKPTPFFTPKSKERRVIPVAKVLYDAITPYLRKDDPFIVPGRTPKVYAEGKRPKNLVYRCDQHHRALAWWLRVQGIQDKKPCHLLRKQFGSYVATVFGLYHAQKLLGHRSPKVTSDYYAGLTDLPEVNNLPPTEARKQIGAPT
jgi:integrase